MIKRSKVYYFFTAIIFTAQIVLAQDNPHVAIEKAIAEYNTGYAHTLVQQQIDKYYLQRNADSINEYIFYTGKIAGLKNNSDYGVKQVEALIQKIKTLSPSPYTLRQTYVEAGEYYGFAGKNNLAYKANEVALGYSLSFEGQSQNEVAIVHNNLSTYAQRMANVRLSEYHSREALKYLLDSPHPNYETLYMTYNGMGTKMWYASKLDSATYYFNQAIETLKKTKATPVNQFYRPAIIQNNLAGIYGVQGKPTEAIKAMKSCITSLRLFISSKEPDNKKSSAVSFQFEATDNLAGIYKDIGDYRQAHDLLTYSYQQKQKQLGADDPAIFISEILLGQLYFAMREHDKALQLLNSGLHRISKIEGDYLFWQADACNTLALVYDEKGDAAKATPFYEKADSLYEASLQGEYDNIYLEFLRNAGLFYAENKLLPKALTKANKAYNYITKTEGTASLLHFYQLLNLSEIHFASADYTQAVNYSNKALEVVNTVVRSSNSLLDSIHVELKKPKAILLKAKSSYQLLSKKEVGELQNILNNLKEALNILEKRKSVLQDAKDIKLLVADHSELLEFIKEIELELFGLTNNEQYADELISLHESGIYNRIRSRLDKSGDLQFANLPADVTKKEKALKTAMVNALTTEGDHYQVMQAYIQSEENWNQYLEQLRTQYPRYYKMRYGSIFKSVKEIQSQLPAKTTIIRYFFAGKSLLAFVMDQQQKQLIRLPVNALEKDIVSLSNPVLDVKQTSEILYRLYQQLWTPLAKAIRYNTVVIIPDGILFNLSFETLTAEKIDGFNDLATNSLLAKHAISYQYSLFLTDRQPAQPGIDKSFVGFAPGFSDEIKLKYQQSRDSSDFDNSYLTLLPQPFTISLAKKTQNLFGGNTYLHDESTLNSFKTQAGQHKIIYIGTHAEADNLHPEFSKLIFAKNTSAKDENNSLYLFDIYNCNLSSNLAVLTACESGVPGYEDGEGMISLAHAFSYAGSESIVTGLWKIDEQSSAQLMELFYDNLLSGMSKDEALRQAKLSWLKQSRGRALAPQYWAGLVLIGDTSPVSIQQNRNWLWYVAGGLLLLIAIIFLVKRRNQ